MTIVEKTAMCFACSMMAMLGFVLYSAVQEGHRRELSDMTERQEQALARSNSHREAIKAEQLSLFNEKAMESIAAAQNDVINKMKSPSSFIEKEVKSTPVIETNENHYHFDKLSTAMKYIGIAILMILSLQVFTKLARNFKSSLIIKKAVKKSSELSKKFKSTLSDRSEYLSISTEISEQLVINNILIDDEPKKHKILELISKTEKLKIQLKFLEQNLMGQYQ